MDVPHKAHVQEVVWNVNDPKVARKLEAKALATQQMQERSLKQKRYAFGTALSEAAKEGGVERMPKEEAISRRYPS